MQVLSLTFQYGSLLALVNSNSLLESLLIFILITFCSTRYNKAVNEEDPVIHAILLVLLILFTLLFGIGLFMGFMLKSHIAIELISSMLMTTLLLLFSNIISALDFIKSINTGRNFFIILFSVTHISLYFCIGKGLIWLPIDIGAILASFAITNLNLEKIFKSY